MSPLIVRSRVDADGVLRIVVPVGAAEADQEMQVTIEPVASPAPDQSDYASWLAGLAGNWQGKFERVPESEFEARDSM